MKLNDQLQSLAKAYDEIPLPTAAPRVTESSLHHHLVAQKDLDSYVSSPVLRPRRRGTLIVVSLAAALLSVLALASHREIKVGFPAGPIEGAHPEPSPVTRAVPATVAAAAASPGRWSESGELGTYPTAAGIHGMLAATTTTLVAVEFDGVPHVFLAAGTDWSDAKGNLASLWQVQETVASLSASSDAFVLTTSNPAGGRLLSSVDGRTWRESSPGNTARPYVTYAYPTGFVATSTENGRTFVFRSSNGVLWNTIGEVVGAGQVVGATEADVTIGGGGAATMLTTYRGAGMETVASSMSTPSGRPIVGYVAGAKEPFLFAGPTGNILPYRHTAAGFVLSEPGPTFDVVTSVLLKDSHIFVVGSYDGHLGIATFDGNTWIGLHPGSTLENPDIDVRFLSAALFHNDIIVIGTVTSSNSTVLRSWTFTP